MTEPQHTTLSVDEREAFLRDGGTGVLSFSTREDDAPHSIPVSYGYDAVEADFYFRLATGDDSEKWPPEERPVTFVAYGREDDRWVSVVASGNLHETTDSEVADETIAGLERVHIPFVDIFGDPPADVQFQFYRLDPDSLTARGETPTEV